MERISIEVALVEGTNSECFIVIESVEDARKWRMWVEGFGMPIQEVVAHDLFEAMCGIRRSFELLDARLLCVGAQKDVYPSRMSRGMSGGRKAYQTRMGFQARKADLVEIFDRADAELVGTVDEQVEFHERWLESLGSKQ